MQLEAFLHRLSASFTLTDIQQLEQQLEKQTMLL